MSGIWKPSEAAALSLHAMSYLAQDPSRWATTREIAEKFKVSENHLAKVHQRLVKAGLIVAARGPSGGFHLAKDPKDITLLQIYEVIEGPILCESCVFAEPTCGREDCIFGGLLKEVNAQISDYLSKTTLAMLVEKPKLRDQAKS